MYYVSNAAAEMRDIFEKEGSKLNESQANNFEKTLFKLKETLNKKEENELAHYLILALPFIAIELLLLYYFRIVLNMFLSNRSQMMQLQVRNSVCQFIQDYVKFKHENKESSGGLEKFEALVFSSLAPSDDKVPSTFDGLDQLGDLVKKIKG
jgi:hypothetical protein